MYSIVCGGMFTRSLSTCWDFELQRTLTVTFSSLLTVASGILATAVLFSETEGIRVAYTLAGDKVDSFQIRAGDASMPQVPAARQLNVSTNLEAPALQVNRDQPQAAAGTLQVCNPLSRAYV
jgi:hypothetical protein